MTQVLYIVPYSHNLGQSKATLREGTNKSGIELVKFYKFAVKGYQPGDICAVGEKGEQVLD